jgi:hypothetical protein
MDEIKYMSMSDDDIKFYLGKDAPILKYNELAKYKTIEKLLPKHKAFFILLYPVTSDSSGHWVALTRFNNTIEYYDSYGGIIDDPLNWKSSKFRGNKRYLSEMLNKTKLNVDYNSFDFQSKRDTMISTCGCYSVFRVLTMIELNADLEKNNLLLQTLKDSNEDMSYDDIVVQYINKR